MTRFALLLCALAGCFSSNSDDSPFGGGTPACTDSPTIAIDTNATVTHEAGVDPGYYIEYDGAGAWHLEWTCDTKLSAYGCEFSGAIITQTPVTATCYQCEAADEMSQAPHGAGTEIDFDTETSTGIDGVDFTASPGDTIEVDLRVNGIYQPDLVIIPSGGATVSPTCLPIALAPTTP